MNKRIEELALEARAYCDTLDVADSQIYNQIWQRQFAELIVRECCKVLLHESDRLYGLAAEETDELFADNFEICAEKCIDNMVHLEEHFELK